MACLQMIIMDYSQSVTDSPCVALVAMQHKHTQPINSTQVILLKIRLDLILKLTLRKRIGINLTYKNEIPVN